MDVSVAARRQLGVLAVVALLLALLPSVYEGYLISFMILGFTSIVMTTSWNLFSGFTGFFSLGHGLFFGVGAYAFSSLVAAGGWSPWLAMALGGVLAMLVAMVIGTVLVKLRVGIVYLAVMMLAINELFRTFFLNWDLAGGAAGVTIPLYAPSSFVYLTALFLALVGVAANIIVAGSSWGLAARAIKEDETVASTSGVDARRVKYGLFVVSSPLPGLIGALTAWYWSYMDPYMAFDLIISFNAAIFTVLGGVGTVLGPVLGSILATVLGEILDIGAPYLQTLILGTIVIVFTLWVPGGVVSLFRSRRRTPRITPRLATAPRSRES